MTGKISSQTSNKTPSDRSVARLLAVQALFEVEATRNHYDEVTKEALARDASLYLDAEGEDEISADKKLAQRIVRDAVTHQNNIDQTVNTVLNEGWPLKSVDPTLRAIFRAASAEFIRGKVPFKVVINEYLDLTRAFDDRQETVSFVNAVLDNTRKNFLSEAD